MSDKKRLAIDPLNFLSWFLLYSVLGFFPYLFFILIFFYKPQWLGGFFAIVGVLVLLGSAQQALEKVGCVEGD